MDRGQGNISRTNKIDPPVIPPATVTAAQNGLTLVGTIVELGGANPLIHATAIELGAFSLSATRAGNGVFLLNPGARRYAIGELTGANQTFFDVDDTNQTIFANHSSGKYLYLDMGIRQFTLGDFSSTGNDSKFVVKDTSQAVSMEAGLSPSLLTLTGAVGSESLILNIAASPYLTLNPNTGQYFIGDAGNVFNGTLINIQDNAQLVTVSSGPNAMLSLDMGLGVYQIGDLTPNANQTLLNIDDSTQIISTGSAGMVNGLILDFGNLNFVLGDVFGAGNQTYFQIDDSTQVFSTNSNAIANGFLVDMSGIRLRLGDYLGAINNTVIDIRDSTQKILINAALGTGINANPTASALAVALAPFANNAAAVLGGLGVGDFYRISIAGTSTVAVVQ